MIAYNNTPYARFAEKGIAARYAGDRLPNVQQVTSAIEELELVPASLDAAVFIMSYHDLYWRPADGSWPPTDAAQLLGKLHAALLAHPDDAHTALVFDEGGGERGRGWNARVAAFRSDRAFPPLCSLCPLWLIPASYASAPACQRR